MIGFHLANLWRMLWMTADGAWLPLVACGVLTLAVALTRARR